MKDRKGTKFTTDYEFIETKKLYNLFYTDSNGKKTALVSHPMKSLF